MRAGGILSSLLALGACGGSGSSLQTAPPARPDAGHATIAAFTIRVPARAATASALRRPTYISPNSQSAVIKLASVNGVVSPQPATIVNLTPTSKNCSSSGGTLVCSAAIEAPAGTDAFSLTLFSAPGGAGSQLSSGSVSATIVAGAVNTVPLTLNGIVSTIAVNLSRSRVFTSGEPSTIGVAVTATDATGATIVGPGSYVPPIALADSDVSGNTSLSSTSITGPGTAVTLRYDGSAALLGHTVTISASAPAIPPSDIQSASFTPTSASGTTISGTAAFAVLTDSAGNAVAEIPTSAGVVTVPLAAPGGGILSVARTTPGSGRRPAAAPTAPPALPLSPAPDECAPDLADNELDCMSYASGTISIVAFNSTDLLTPLKLVGQIITDAPAAGVEYSGGTCQVCGIAYDPIDNAVIVATANGYELYAAAAATLSPTTVTAPLTTVAAPVSENFGYNANTDQIFSPYYFDFGVNPWAAPYANLDVVGIAGGVGTWFDLSAADIPAGLYSPDAGAVDTTTGIAVAPEEGTYPIYLQLIPQPGSSAFTTAAHAPNAPGGTVNMAVSAVTPANATEILNAGCEEAYTAVDSVKDLAFFGAEYSPVDCIAVGQLPTTPSVPTGFGSYVDAVLPALPNGGAFASPDDPHAAIVVNIPGVCADCGILFNYDKSYVAIVDLNKLLALAPAAEPNGYDVPASANLLQDGVVQYVATHVSSAPSEFLRARAAYHAAHRFKNNARTNVRQP
jgi:hypothetical protein